MDPLSQRVSAALRPWLAECAGRAFTRTDERRAVTIFRSTVAAYMAEMVEEEASKAPTRAVRRRVQARKPEMIRKALLMLQPVIRQAIEDARHAERLNQEIDDDFSQFVTHGGPNA